MDTSREFVVGMYCSACGQCLGVVDKRLEQPPEFSLCTPCAEKEHGFPILEILDGS